MKVKTPIQSAAKVMMLFFALSVCELFHQPRQPVSSSRPRDIEKSRDPVFTSKPEKKSLREFTYERIEMAMPVRVTVWAESEATAESACKKAFNRVGELVAVFSDYEDSSEVSRLLKGPVGKPVKVSPELMEVLAFSQALSKRSNRAFDPTIGPVIRLWRDARNSQTLPNQEAIELAKQQSGFERLLVDSGNCQVTMLTDSAKLDFGGVAKGYIGDQIIKLLKNEGVSIAKFHAGGDVVLGDAPPDSKGWQIKLSQDEQQKNFYLSNCGVSTSGDRYQFVEIDGTRYSHVVDPQTGLGMTTGRTAFVVAESGMQSDALATSGCVMSDSEFKTLLKSEDSQGWVEASSFH